MASEDREREFLKEVGAKLISVSEAAQLSKFTRQYVRRLLKGDKIPGVQIDRDWFTTREALRAYLQTDRRPGPKTD